jgi:adenylyltransferase/sulfurtransferase
MFKFKNTRYNRQENMPEWGPDRQRNLKKARVAVIGSGGVKTTLLTALAAGGIGYIRIIEFDKVELSNLNRQTLFIEKNIGKPKGLIASKTLAELNPEINIEWINQRITKKNIEKYLDTCDFIVEGGESPAARNLVNEYCLKFKKPFVHASAQFNYGYAFSVIPDERTACFACFFPNDHTRKISTGAVPVSVLSTQIAGTLGAAEVFKWFLGYKNKMIVNRRLCFSSLLLSENFEYLQQKRRPNCPICRKYYTE